MKTGRPRLIPVPPREEFAGLYKTLHIADIAARYNVSNNTIYNWVKFHGISSKGRGFAHKTGNLDKDEIVRLFEAGHTIIEIAALLEVSVPTLRKFAQANRLAVYDVPADFVVIARQITSTLDLANHYNVSEKVVYYWRRVTGVKVVKTGLLRDMYKNMIFEHNSLNTPLFILVHKNCLEYATVRNYFRRNRIKIKDRHIMNRLIITDKLSDTEIAEKFGVACEFVQTWMRNNRMHYVYPSESRRPSYEKLKHFVDLGYRPAMIAAGMKVTTDMVYKWFDFYRIPYRKRGGSEGGYQKRTELPVTEKNERGIWTRAELHSYFYLDLN